MLTQDQPLSIAFRAVFVSDDDSRRELSGSLRVPRRIPAGAAVSYLRQQLALRCRPDEGYILQEVNGKDYVW